ncbi:unnamed protein product [Lupinus luteus]|uniref:Glycosyltransferase n=1 Tax=Lupinus luteus TaxID=3873 RepID=A0AAV1WWL1_LUPLU
MSRFADTVNSCDVLIGVHGAGLTNTLFLPENAVFIQVVPYGRVEWLAKNDSVEPSKDMNLKSTRNTKSSWKKAHLYSNTLYSLYHIIVKDGQKNGRLDVNRFNPTLLKAL